MRQKSWRKRKNYDAERRDFTRYPTPSDDEIAQLRKRNFYYIFEQPIMAFEKSSITGTFFNCDSQFERTSLNIKRTTASRNPP